MENDNLKLKISFYPDGERSDALIEKIKKVAEQNGGVFDFLTEVEDDISMNFDFQNEEDKEFAHEIILLLLGKYMISYYDFETPETQIDTRMFPEGIYHHLTFYDEQTARNCASMLMATFAAYAPEDYFDICLVEIDGDDETPDEYLVVFGFPFDSVVLMPDEIEQILSSFENDDMMALPSTDKPKRKDELN